MSARTDTSRLKKAAQAFSLRFAVLTPRQFALADVNGSGADTGAAPSDSAAYTTDYDFQGVSAVSIRGSIAQGGWTADLTIPFYLAAFEDYWGVEIYLKTWHGGIPGVIGAAGVDPDDILIFRGYMRGVTASRKYGERAVVFHMESSSSFLRDSSFTRGIDMAAGLPHGAPGDSNYILSHLLLYHTNFYPRSNYGIYLPAHSVDAFSVNEGSVLSMLKQLCDNFALEGQVYCRREDDIVLGAHPNLSPSLHPNINSPIIELDDELVLAYEVPEEPPSNTDQVTVEVQHSDQTSYAARYYGLTGLGSRNKYQIRSDDNAIADELAALQYAHLNRRYKAVKVMTGLLVSIDLGDVVLVTTTLPQRGVTWNARKFFVTDIEYRIDIQRQQFQATYTLDALAEGL